MWTELRVIINEASACSDVRVVVLASRLNKGFTAGLDGAAGPDNPLCPAE